MKALEISTEWLPLALQAWLLILLVNKGLSRRFPLFLLYIVSQIVTGLARATLISNKSYFYVYWWTAGIEALLSFLAIHESFRAVFRAFYRLQWFRMLWPGAIALIWAYAAWRAWANPPSHFTRTGAMLVSVAIVASYTIVGLALLFFLLVKIVRIRWHLYEFSIVYGIGFALLGMMIAALVRSEFGKKFAFMTEWGPPLAYLVGVLVWISAFLRTEPEIRIDTPPDVLLRGMRENLNVVRKISGTRGK